VAAKCHNQGHFSRSMRLTYFSCECKYREASDQTILSVIYIMCRLTIFHELHKSHGCYLCNQLISNYILLKYYLKNVILYLIIWKKDIKKFWFSRCCTYPNIQGKLLMPTTLKFLLMYLQTFNLFSQRKYISLFPPCFAPSSNELQTAELSPS